MLARHVLRLLAEVIHMSIRTRQLTLLFAVLGGLVIVAVVIVAQATAPLAIYPFI